MGFFIRRAASISASETFAIRRRSRYLAFSIISLIFLAEDVYTRRVLTLIGPIILSTLF